MISLRIYRVLQSADLTSRKISALGAAFLVLTLTSLALPGLSAPDLSKKPSGTSQSKAAQKLHRADFRVKGASCVACLRRISKTMREQNGVLKADVSIFKPYWAIAIYDQGKTNMDKIYESVKAEKVTFEEMEDHPIDSLPMIVIPKGMNKAEASAPAGSAAAPSSSH